MIRHLDSMRRIARGPLRGRAVVFCGRTLVPNPKRTTIDPALVDCQRCLDNFEGAKHWVYAQLAAGGGGKR